MKINNISTINFNGNPIHIKGKKLIPLAEYKGPILKLTKSDKEEIELLKRQLRELDEEYWIILRYMETKKNINHMLEFYKNKLLGIRTSMHNIKESIEKVKIRRLDKMVNK